MVDVGWENGRLVPVSAEGLGDALIREGGADSTHPIWGAIDDYVRICKSIAAEQNICLPPSFGQVDQVAPWLPRMAESSSVWKRCQQETRRLGTIHFGLLVVEHTRLSRAHYQHAITPLSVTYYVSCALPGFPYGVRGQRFWLDVLRTHEEYVRDDRMGTSEQVALALGEAWDIMADLIQAAGPNMLARCVRKGGVVT